MQSYAVYFFLLPTFSVKIKAAINETCVKSMRSDETTEYTKARINESFEKSDNFLNNNERKRYLSLKVQCTLYHKLQ